MAIPERSIDSNGHRFGERDPDRHDYENPNGEFLDIQVGGVVDAFLVFLNAIP